MKRRKTLPTLAVIYGGIAVLMAGVSYDEFVHRRWVNGMMYLLLTAGMVLFVWMFYRLWRSEREEEVRGTEQKAGLPHGFFSKERKRKHRGIWPRLKK